MTKTTQVGVRFPKQVLELIDRFAKETTAELRENLPGLEVNRAGAIRILVEQALRERGYELAKETADKGKRRSKGKKK